MPLTVGGGIRGFTDGEGRSYSARDVAAEYFRSGADKVWTALLQRDARVFVGVFLLFLTCI